MGEKSRGQASIEFLVVIGFAMLMITPVIIMYYDQKSDINDRVNTNQAFQIARKIVDAADSVYYFGEPSKTTIRVYMPGNVENVTFSNKEVVIKVKTQPGVTDIVQISKVNMTGEVDANKGIRDIEISAKGDYVLVNGTV